MTEYFSEVNNVNAATLVPVNSGSDTATGINFTMDEGGKITGQVTDSQSGLPLPSIQISANEYDNGDPTGIQRHYRRQWRLYPHRYD